MANNRLYVIIITSLTNGGLWSEDTIFDPEVKVRGDEMRRKSLLEREIAARARVVRLWGMLETAEYEKEVARIDSLVGNAHPGPEFARAVAWDLALELNERLQAAVAAKGRGVVIKAIVNQANPEPFELTPGSGMKGWILRAGGALEKDLLIYQKALEGWTEKSRIRLLETSDMDVVPL